METCAQTPQVQAGTRLVSGRRLAVGAARSAVHGQGVHAAHKVPRHVLLPAESDGDDAGKDGGAESGRAPAQHRRG